MTNNNYRADRVDIVKDMKTRGCPACDHIWENVYDFFSHWVYDLATDENIQNENADELGLCPFHTWQFAAIGSPQGISRGYVKLMKHISNKLLKWSYSPADTQMNIAMLIKDDRECRICTLMRDTEIIYLKQLAKFMSFAENRRLYTKTQGLCLRHLGLLIKEISASEIVQFLLTEASKHFNECAADMENYSLKHTALQRYLLNKNEKDAYVRAVIHAVGGKLVCIQGNKDV